MWMELLALSAAVAIPLWLAAGFVPQNRTPQEFVDEMRDSGIYRERHFALTYARWALWGIVLFLVALCAVGIIPL